MSNELLNSLKETLSQATSKLSYNGEEEGGFILEGENGFDFLKVKNANTGNSLAAVEFWADPVEFGAILAKLGPNVKIHSSVHTHPGRMLTPSTKDLTKLFTSFPINYIYAPGAKKVYKYELIDCEDHVVGKPTFPAFDTRGEEIDNKVWQAELAVEL